MEKIEVRTPLSSSEIYVGEKWEAGSRLLPDAGVVIITDENVRQLYGNRFPKGIVLSIPAGEESKRLELIQQLAAQLLEEGIDRSGFILAIGGGVVCDLAGFLAAIYFRGIRCGYISTTLLSQVDASTGGKNGVNLGGTKNILGVIRQPEFVICDPEMLITLPDDEYLSGLSELIKTAIIGNKELFRLIELKYTRIMSRDQDVMSALIAECVKFKAAVVSEDETEKGLRRILNFGHTFGHAIEMHHSVKHGLAVAAGMEFATEFSCFKGFISNAEKNRIMKLLKRFGFFKRYDISDDDLLKLIKNDKKKTGNDLNFVFTEGIGKSAVSKITVNEIIDFHKLFKSKK